MIFDEDNNLGKRGIFGIGDDLSGLSLEELDARIVSLQAEIERVQQEKIKKKSSMDIAASAFKI